MPWVFKSQAPGLAGGLFTFESGEPCKGSWWKHLHIVICPQEALLQNSVGHLALSGTAAPLLLCEHGPLCPWQRCLQLSAWKTQISACGYSSSYNAIVYGEKIFSI